MKTQLIINMADKLDTDTKVEVIIDDENKLYKCLKCNEISKRRYNAERHYKRFHENTFPKKICCGTIFPTKGDFYVHKEIAHNEKRKYQERFKKQFQISKIDEFKDSENISNVLYQIYLNIFFISGKYYHIIILSYNIII
ncbi:hypothetical protein P5V15_008713 [Pogonomyrmex californicus]